MVVWTSPTLPFSHLQCNFYLFVVHGAYINLAGAIDYFYTADAECVPDGPHFSYTYYSTWSSVVQSVMGAVGVMLFQVCEQTPPMLQVKEEGHV